MGFGVFIKELLPIAGGQRPVEFFPEVCIHEKYRRIKIYGVTIFIKNRFPCAPM
jgi:hypothetical protein